MGCLLGKSSRFLKSSLNPLVLNVAFTVSFAKRMRVNDCVFMAIGKLHTAVLHNEGILPIFKR